MKRSTTFHRYYAAAYIRLSREDGDKEESDSVGNQKRLLTEYVQRQEGLVLRDFYVDDGYSGTNFNRPGFQRMMADIDSGSVNCVIVKDLSRFGRDYIDSGRYLERIFPEKNVRFIAVTDGIDSLKQSYDMLLPIKNIFNEQYARDISRKIQAAVGTKQRAGQFIGSFASYGYMKSPEDKNKLVPDEYAADVVRQIFRMYIGGYGKQEIAKILNREGILCPSAYKRAKGMHYRNGNCSASAAYWSYTTIAKILRSEIYLGNMVQGTKRQQMRGKQKAVPKEKWIVVPGTHEPIIERDVWEKAQILLEKRTRNTDVTPSFHIFAGFLKCGDCGRAMMKHVWRLRDGTPRYHLVCGTYRRNGKEYCTPHSIPFRVLESIVLQDLKSVIQSVDHLQELVEQQKGMKDGSFAEKQIDHLNAALEKTLRLKQSVYEDYREGLLTREEYISFRSNYLAKERQLSEQLECWKERKEKESSTNAFADSWVKRLVELRDVEKLDRGIVAGMIHEIRVYEEHKILIAYNFSREPGHVFSDTFVDRTESVQKH